MSRRVKHEEHPLVTENRILQTRLRLAQTFNTFMQTAYDALLHYSINYRELPEYKDPQLLDEALGNGVSVDKGESKIVQWIERATSGINAAIRRKRFKRLDS